MNLSILKFKDLVNNIKNITISEIDAKKDLNVLKEIKNVEITKYKRRTLGHKKSLNLFNDLSDIVLTDKTLESENQENENEKVESRKEENEKVESRREENEDKVYENESEYENEDENYENKYENEDEDDDDETMDQNKKKSKIIKEKNDNLNEIIDKSKSFEEQIELLKKREDLNEYYPCRHVK